MSGNLCRCGAYANIVPAILDGAGPVKRFDYDARPAVARGDRALGDDRTALLGGGTNLVDLMKLGVAHAGPRSSTSRTCRSTASTWTRDGGLRIGATRPQQRPRRPPGRARAVPGARPRPCSPARPASCATPPPRPATCCNAPAARTSWTSTKPCNKREPGTGCPARDGVAPQARRARVRRSTASPPIRPTWPWRSPCSMPSSSWRGPEGERALDLDNFYLLPHDTPHLETTLAAGRSDHRGGGPGAARGHPQHLPQGARPRRRPPSGCARRPST